MRSHGVRQREYRQQENDEPKSFPGFHLERFKKYRSQFGARIFGFWRGFGEGAGLKNPVTEPKRSQKPKRPPLRSLRRMATVFFKPL
jgi:hypothetical protein